MPFLPVELSVDLTATHAAIVVCLKQVRAMGMYLLNTKQDGDPVVNADGNVVPWTPEIRAQVEAEVAETDRMIAELS